MVVIRCEMKTCPFHGAEDFCQRRAVLRLDNQGMCSEMWQNGNLRWWRQPHPVDNIKEKEENSNKDEVKSEPAKDESVSAAEAEK